MTRYLAGAIPLLLVLLGGAAAAQEGDATPPWQLTFRHKALDVITVHYKDGSAQSFYFMRFSLSNDSQATAQLALHFRAVVGSNPRKQRVHLAAPQPEAEEAVRRLAGQPGLKNVQQINGMKELAPGSSVDGIAVLGTFHREWDVAVISVSGLESPALTARVRKFGDAGFTVAHRAYGRHNAAVLEAAGEDPSYTEANAVVRHDVVWVMRYRREGDEFSPHLDPTILVDEGWDVVEDPAPEIVLEREKVFG